MIIYDSEYIENINWAMVFSLESENRLCGKEIVCEDGRITQVYEGKDRLIKEKPTVGSEVWISGKRAGKLKQDYDGTLYLKRNGDYYDLTALRILSSVNDVKFVTPDGRLIC